MQTLPCVSWPSIGLWRNVYSGPLCEMVRLCQHSISHTGQNHQNIKCIKIICETCFRGAGELNANSLRVADSLSNEIIVGKPTSPWHVSFMLKMEVSDSHA